MFYALVLAALLGVCLAEEDHHGHHSRGGGLLGGHLGGFVEPRLAVSAIRIHQLEQHIERLREKIEEAKHVDPERFVHELDARLNHLEGTHCEDREFQCGHNGQECINDLFMCDGHEDCHNGHDEDDDVCSTDPVKAGNIFTGLAHWKDCQNRDDHLVQLQIISFKRFKFFSARVLVKAILTAIYTDKGGVEKTSKVTLHGGYNFNNRRVLLIPDEHGEHSAHLGLKCEFNLGDDERADCVLLTEASLHECANIHLSLEHHDDDDDDDDHH
jgi:hypothetical protein